MTNMILVVGRLTKDPELRYLPGTGTPVSKFIVAVDRDYKKANGEKITDFLPVEIMGKTAEFCANYITKGRLVSIQGSMYIDRYVDSNSSETKTFAKIAANKIQILDKKKEHTSENDVQGALENSYYSEVPTSDIDDDLPF